METIRLDGRLSAAASLIREGRALADVGCDHGYLIGSLAQSGRIPGGIACDLRPGPLSKAQELIQCLGLGGRISTRLCDGLSGVAPEECADVAIAGMGGETIVKILSETPWLREPDRLLTLQPQTRAEILRRWLAENGFSILREAAGEARGKVYVALSAAYTGTGFQPDLLWCYTGRLPENRDEASRKLLRKLADRLRRAGEGMRRADPARAEEFISLSEQIRQMEGSS